MSVQRLVVSDFVTGLETDRIPELIKNDAFPTLVDAYIWRGRILRKRGDQLLGRLRRSLTSVAAGTFTTATPSNTLAIFTALGLNVAEPNAGIVPMTLTIVFGAPISQTLTDVSGNGTLTVTGAGTITAATINYSTGIVTIFAGAVIGPASVTISVIYFPVLPVMGIEDFNIGSSPQPIPITFDTRYSYGFDQGLNQFYDVTFYKNTHIPFTWFGHNYDQFWTTNYLGVTTITNVNSPSGCLWATNGNPGFHFLNGTYVSGSGTALITFNFTSLGLPFQTLVVGDILWFNEWGTGGSTINGVNGTVTTIVNAATGTYEVTFAGVQTVAGTGIAQMLTNFVSGQDGIRWYDGDPTVGGLPNALGWVNFAPPLSTFNAATNPNPRYLVGAKIILPFKNRLLCFGVYTRTSQASPGAQFFPNRVQYSEVGSPFYSLPLPFDISTSSPVPNAWDENVAGRGGFIAAPIDDTIIVVGENDDVLLVIFETQPLKLIYTSNDTLPFIFQTVSAELGSLSTFSGVRLDTGILSVGTYGITLCTSTSVQRVDLIIPDRVFDFGIADNKPNRLTAIRDYQKEFVYFTYSPGIVQNKTFPSQTLVYNYRENNWALFNENYTTYGTFRRTTNRTWSNIGLFYPTWSEWTDPWDFGASQAFFPQIVGGNQHGFVMIKGQSIAEEGSEIIFNIAGNIITSPSHGLTTGDFIEIVDPINSTGLNGNIEQIVVTTENTFTINDSFGGTYTGGATFARLSRPFIQTKQFPIFWDAARGARLGTSRFLIESNASPDSGIIIDATQANPCVITSIAHGLSSGTSVFISQVQGMIELNSQNYVITVLSADTFSLNNIDSTTFTAYQSGGEWSLAPPQITVNIYSSQNANTPSNDKFVSPYIPFNATVLTCAEPSLYSTATPPYESQQAQIWHRLNTSINGDTVQLGFTLSDSQMRDKFVNEQEIIIHAIVMDLYPGPTLAI